jgi:uncharacterized protein
MRRGHVIAVLLALAATACSSSPVAVRWYLLEPGSGEAEPSPVPLAINVGPVELAESLDRPQLVRRLGPNEVDFVDDARWGEPLAHGIARVLAENLGRQLGTERVGVVPGFETPEESWHVTVYVLRFELEGDEAVMEARFRLTAPGEARPKTTGRRIAIANVRRDLGMTDASALSLCLDALAEDIAAAVVAP